MDRISGFGPEDGSSILSGLVVMKKRYECIRVDRGGVGDKWDCIMFTFKGGEGGFHILRSDVDSGFYETFSGGSLKVFAEPIRGMRGEHIVGIIHEGKRVFPVVL